MKFKEGETISMLACGKRQEKGKVMCGEASLRVPILLLLAGEGVCCEGRTRMTKDRVGEHPIPRGVAMSDDGHTVGKGKSNRAHIVRPRSLRCYIIPSTQFLGPPFQLGRNSV